jgi:hypothetical protein
MVYTGYFRFFKGLSHEYINFYTNLSEIQIIVMLRQYIYTVLTNAVQSIEPANMLGCLI